MTRGLILSVIWLLGFVGAPHAQKLPLPDLDAATVETFRTYLDAHHRSPEAYIAGKFKDHDVVFVGEYHCIKHDGILIQKVIPLLYENGVHVLATEFARREDQPLIDSLMALPEYDESIAHEVMFRQFLHHPYQEYADIFRAGWELNHGIPADAPRFRIVGINDSPDWSYVKTRADRDNDDIKRKVWHGQSERMWADVILAEVSAGEKVLVYCGMHHAFTEYQMPVVNTQTGEFIRLYNERVGNYVYGEIGKRAITISLHHPWYDTHISEPAVYATGGMIDAVMKALGPDAYPVGFDTKGTPFGELPAGEGCLYVIGHEGLTLGDWCDGYVFTKPISEYEGMTPIPDFVDEGNLERARATSWDPDFRHAGVAQFQFAAMVNANIPWKFRQFE